MVVGGAASGADLGGRVASLNENKIILHQKIVWWTGLAVAVSICIEYRCKW